MDIKDIKKLYANPIQFYKESPQNIVEMPEKRDDNTLYIYGPIMVEHMRLLIEEIFGNAVGVVSSMSFKSELQNLSGEITLRINSPGGDIEKRQQSQICCAHTMVKSTLSLTVDVIQPL